jgi:hypothetical protein
MKFVYNAIIFSIIFLAVIFGIGAHSEWVSIEAQAAPTTGTVLNSYELRIPDAPLATAIKVIEFYDKRGHHCLLAYNYNTYSPQIELSCENH